MMAEASSTRESFFMLPQMKVLAGQSHKTERIYIVFGFHHGELVVSDVDKPVETVAGLYGQCSSGR